MVDRSPAVGADAAHLIAAFGDPERKEGPCVIIILKHLQVPKAQVCPAWQT